jgi:S-adenosylmethionine-diacylglycerol 3-amino-3-carboxypropyl transferase
MSVASAELLKTAVHQNSLMSRKGLLERMFSYWFNDFVYNQIWEDPQVDLAALQLQEDSRILTIASGGCNILNYLVERPAVIVAVDLNPYHMYLTRLKLAALEHLPDYEAFFDFFGYADKPSNVTNYYTYIRKHLDQATRDFWEGGSWLRQKMGKQRINYFSKNVYHYARFGYFMRFLYRVARLSRYEPTKILQAKTLEEQQEIFDQHIAPYFDNWLVKNAGNFSFAVFSLGIPPQQYRYMKEESNGRLVELYRERVKRLVCQFPIQDNYFAWQGFSLRYDVENRQAIPAYLKEENYEGLKQNLSRVETHITSLIEYLKSQPNNSLDRFVLLDSQDWMTSAVMTELWQEIARVGRPGTRIIFRTASPASPIESMLPSTLKSQFEYEQTLSQELFQKDRSAIYGGFHIYAKTH